MLVSFILSLVFATGQRSAVPVPAWAQELFRTPEGNGRLKTDAPTAEPTITPSIEVAVPKLTTLFPHNGRQYS
jgi:hypothetical protein